MLTITNKFLIDEERNTEKSDNLKKQCLSGESIIKNLNSKKRKIDHKHHSQCQLLKKKNSFKLTNKQKINRVKSPSLLYAKTIAWKFARLKTTKFFKDLMPLYVLYFQMESMKIK